MKSTFLNKMIAAHGLALSLVLSHIACSQSAFQEVSYKSPTAETLATQESTGSRAPASVPSNESDDLMKPSVEGYVTGVRSEGAEFQWENWGLYGTQIQIHYTISEHDTTQTVFQIFPKDVVGAVDGETADPGSLAIGSDDRRFAFAQYFNLEKSRGLHTFSLPLKYNYANGVRQYLKLGDYNLFITACKTAARSSCQKSQAIAFSVKN